VTVHSSIDGERLEVLLVLLPVVLLVVVVVELVELGERGVGPTTDGVLAGVRKS
jgi:hypothetical protein